jgi:hypothetical protein
VTWWSTTLAVAVVGGGAGRTSREALLGQREMKWESSAEQNELETSVDGHVTVEVFDFQKQKGTLGGTSLFRRFQFQVVYNLQVNYSLMHHRERAQRLQIR